MSTGGAGEIQTTVRIPAELQLQRGTLLRDVEREMQEAANRLRQARTAAEAVPGVEPITEHVSRKIIRQRGERFRQETVARLVQAAAPAEGDEPAREEIIRVTSRFKKLTDNLKDLRQAFKGLDPEARLALVIGEMATATKARRRELEPIRRELQTTVSRQTESREFQEFRQSLKGLDIEDKLKLVDTELMKGVAKRRAVLEGLKRELERKISQRQESAEFTSFKKSLVGLPLGEQLQELDVEMAFGGFNRKQLDELGMRRRQVLQRMATARRKGGVNRFREFRYDIESLTIPEQLVEIDKEILKGPKENIKALESLKRRVTKTGQMQQRQQFQNIIMGAASASIGVLGTAGFPVLNVAFAAMSGGTMGAAVAATATVFGQLIGTVKEFREEAMQAARSLNLLGSTFKEAEGRMQVLKVFAGGGTTATRIGNQLQSEVMQRALQNETGQFFQNLSAAHELVKTQIATNQGTSPSYFAQLINNYQSIARLNTPEARFRDALEARRSFMIQMSQGSPGIETDPYEVWRRIQTTALDPTKQEAMNLQREQLKSLNKVVDELRKLAAGDNIFNRARRYALYGDTNDAFGQFMGGIVDFGVGAGNPGIAYLSRQLRGAVGW